MAQHTIALNDDTYIKAKDKAKASNLPIGAYIALLVEQSEGVEVVWQNKQHKDGNKLPYGIKHA